MENFADFLRGFPESDVPGLVARFQCIKELVQPGDRPEKTEGVRVALATTLTHLALIVRTFIHRLTFLALGLGIIC